MKLVEIVQGLKNPKQLMFGFKKLDVELEKNSGTHQVDPWVYC